MHSRGHWPARRQTQSGTVPHDRSILRPGANADGLRVPDRRRPGLRVDNRGRRPLSTARGTWKAFERRVASLLGGVRVPVSGRARGDAPDVKHELYAIECKLTSRPSVFIANAMRQAKASATPGQIPIVVVGTKNHDTRDAIVCVRLSDFADWWGR